MDYTGPMDLTLLARGAAELGIDLDARQLEQLDQLARELVAWNRRVNLTRVVDPEGIRVRHVLDSLTCAVPVLPELRADPGPACIDVGSGAGFPGLPLAIAFPELTMTLLEATAKKAAFLEHAVGLLGLDRVAVVAERAEVAARGAPYREAYDLAFARALAPLPVALELCLPFVRPGGRLVLPRGSDLAAQLEDGACAARELGAQLRPALPVALDGAPPGRALVVADKLAPTDARYPRRPGVAAKRPLGCPKSPLA